MSDNGLFLFDNFADRGTVVASSEESTLPSSNLLLEERWKVYRSAATGAVTVDFTLPNESGLLFTHLAIVDCNLTKDGTVRIQGWSDAIGGASSVHDETVGLWDEFGSFGADGYGLGGFGSPIANYASVWPRPVFVHDLGASFSDRYWRLTFDDATVGLAYYQLARVVFAQAWQPTWNFSYGWVQEWEDNNQRTTSEGGQEWVNPRPSPMLLELPYEHLNYKDEHVLQLMRMAKGYTSPFVMQCRPYAGGLQQTLTAVYGRFDSGKFTHASNARVQSNIKIKEVL